MAPERRRRRDLAALVDAASAEHEDKFSGRLCRIQSAERLVRINLISAASTTSALALTQFRHPVEVAFFFFSRGARSALARAGAGGGGRRAML